MSHRLRFSKQAASDIEAVLAYTLDQFGQRKHDQYKRLIRQALIDIAADPCGSKAKRRPEIQPGVCTFHIARRGERARHLFLYRNTPEGFVDIGRLLHDSMELSRHLPMGFERE